MFEKIFLEEKFLFHQLLWHWHTNHHFMDLLSDFYFNSKQTYPATPELLAFYYKHVCEIFTTEKIYHTFKNKFYLIPCNLLIWVTFIKVIDIFFNNWTWCNRLVIKAGIYKVQRRVIWHLLSEQIWRDQRGTWKKIRTPINHKMLFIKYYFRQIF